MGFVWNIPGIPGLWDGKDSGIDILDSAWNLSGIFPVSRDSGMGRTMGRTVHGICLGYSWYPWTMGWEGQWY